MDFVNDSRAPSWFTVTANREFATSRPFMAWPNLTMEIPATPSMVTVGWYWFGLTPHLAEFAIKCARAAVTASRSIRPSDSGLVATPDSINEVAVGVGFGPEMAFTGWVVIPPAISAKLIRKSPNLFALRKLLTSLIYVRC